ncbi:MAG: hypothetical protein QME83_01610 [Thermodesulfobacteriota bacterium]|nr:hypothetical protein [Thermodesulfobacteriota bacterium]
MAYTDRLIEACEKIIRGDWTNALIQICIALDAIAKKTYGGKPGKRIKQYVRDNQYILTRIAMLHLEVHGDLLFQVADGKTMKFEEIVYELIRCALLHEGEMGSRVKIVQSPSIGLDDQGNFLLSVHMIMALCLLLVADPKAVHVTWPDTASFTVEGETIRFSDIKGHPGKLVEVFRTISEKKSNESLHRIANKSGSR